MGYGNRFQENLEKSYSPLSLPHELNRVYYNGKKEGIKEAREAYPAKIAQGFIAGLVAASLALIGALYLNSRINPIPAINSQPAQIERVKDSNLPIILRTNEGER